MTDIAVLPADIEAQRKARNYRLSAIDLPALRVVGSVCLSLAVFLHNHFLLTHGSLQSWITSSAVLGLYAMLAWLLVVYFLRRDPPVDLTLALLSGDVVIWTVAIYATGAESSWLYFVSLLRVADQSQTTFRRSVWFAFLGTFCFGAMLFWVTYVDGRTIALQPAVARLLFILLGGFYISLSARTAEARRGQINGAIRLARDSIKRLVSQSEELREARARAESASAAKSEFLANMSHEMRTPLQGVIGMLQLAIDDETVEHRARQLTTARRSAEVLLATIEDILDFSKIEARRLEIEPSYFSIRDLVAEIMTSLGAGAASKGLKLSYLVHPGVGETLWGDPLRLRQVLVNLVGNAIKFTPRGEVAIRFTRANDEAIRIEVRDTGIGIDPALYARIFEPFEQADSTHSRRYGGTGLGLAIVRSLVQAMGGTIRVEGEEGAGTIFRVELPMTRGTSERTPVTVSSLQGRTIILVEPAPLARQIMAEMLRWSGLNVTEAASRDEVGEQTFDCMLTSEPDVREPMVVIVSPLVPAPGRYEVVWPVSEQELLEALRQALDLSDERPRVVPASGNTPTRSMRVLLVEDNEISQEFIGEALRRLGHEVDLADDGESALQRLSSTEFDIIFMDIQMPGMDGLEATRRFREGGGRTPIVAVTAHSGRDERDRCLRAGMDAVLVKPVYARQMEAVIASLAQTSSILEAVGGNRKLLARVSEAFARQTPPLMQAMEQALQARNGDALYQSAHKLKGSMSNFPGERAAAMAAAMETAAQTGDFEAAARYVAQINDALADFGSRLDAVLASG